MSIELPEKAVWVSSFLCCFRFYSILQIYFLSSLENGITYILSYQVTSVSYIEQLQALAIGYNFGRFQLWSLSSMDLIWASSPSTGNDRTIFLSFSLFLILFSFSLFLVLFIDGEESSPRLSSKNPVTHFSYLQLADDNIFGYLWVGRNTARIR